ncbi:MAG: nitrous oxide reductase [Epsilonproteobacteria bacterium]|nr:nitrous oxide reductase [Campylobacterota bacterium]
MKKVALLLMVAILGAFAFEKSCSNPPLIATTKAKEWCEVCGMNLGKFCKTNHAVELKDGTKKQYCSMHCLAVEYPKLKDKIKTVLVIDAVSGKFIPAKEAFYVVGSEVPGTMSRNSKIAFANKEDALKFQQEYGGAIMRFDEVFKQQLQHLQKENQWLTKKKHKRVYPIGKIVYQNCNQPISKEKFNSIGELKNYLRESKVCGDVRGKRLQALALYIWEAKDKKKLKVPQDAKCPVCGMFVAKYPKWATLLIDKEGNKLYFDGVKDMMKYYFKHPKEIKRAYVSDYYTQEVIEANKAFYVKGSDVLGPMGKELIPFKTEKEAKTFLEDHKGEKILHFEEITPEVIKELD